MHIGVGKESDVFEAFGPKDPQTDISPKMVLKLHRLGRISFRTVKNKRDYLKNNKYNTASKGSWLYLSRLSALKEYGFMKILHDAKFPVPQPIDVCRHGILMSHISGFPLYHAKKIKKPAILCNKALSLLVKLARYGLVHCDYNEFNLMVNDDYELFVIDFPQMISINHKQGTQYFDRDVLCIVNYFKNKHDFEIPLDEIPKIDDDFMENEIIDHLDQVIEASGYYGKNEHIHMDDFETLHKWFGSTIHQRMKNETVDQDDGKEDEDEEEESGEELDEKELWKLKKLKKKQAFQQRRLLKKAIAEHKENVLNDDKKKDGGVSALGSTKSGSEGRTLSEVEIRKRLKKKQKQEVRKQNYKRARKTSDNNKARRDMKREMASNFW